RGGRRGRVRARRRPLARPPSRRPAPRGPRLGHAQPERAVIQSSVFRKVSLNRLASPEQLDPLMTVPDDHGWVALAALGGLLVTGIAWGFLGSIPETVGGLGMLVKSGGVVQVVPETPGRVADVAVAVGDEVHEGQVVARIEQPDLANQVHQAKV